MADVARKWTDKKLAQMEKRVKGIYSEAQKGIQEKWDKYMDNAGKRVEKLQIKYNEALKTGEASEIKKAKKELRKAKENVTLRNQYYKDMVEDTTRRLAHTNEIALAYLNGEMPSIYVKNYNQIKGDAQNIGIKFNIINEDVIKQRITKGDISNPFMRSQKFLNIPKDMRWNTRQINNQVIQGILQGESMDKIADRILPVVGNNENAAIRNARTMVTGAENSGRIDSYHRLEELGAVVKKVWIATGDGRTRDWHLSMDGQEVDVNDYFIDGNGNELEYPGDSGAPPETVYNCRCSMKTHIIGFRKSNGDIEHLSLRNRSESHEKGIEAEKEQRKNGSKNKS